MKKIEEKNPRKSEFQPEHKRKKKNRNDLQGNL